MLQQTAQQDQYLTAPTDSPTVPTVPTVPTAVGVHDLAAQRDWEQYQVSRGIWRYQASLKREIQHGTRKGQMVDRPLAGLEPGQRIADDLIVPLTQAIKARQDLAHEKIEAARQKLSDEDPILLTLQPEVLAVVTIQAALSRCEAAALQGVALDLGGKIMREVELRTWKAIEKAAEKERKQANAEWKANLYELMVKRNDTVDERVFAKWSKKAALFMKGDWTIQTRTRIGMVLLSLLVELDGWFEVDTVKEGFKTKHMFQLTDAARSWVSKRHHQNEMSRPFLLPMICEPRDYEYLPTKVVLTEDDESDGTGTSS